MGIRRRYRTVQGAAAVSREAACCNVGQGTAKARCRLLSHSVRRQHYTVKVKQTSLPAYTPRHCTHVRPLYSLHRKAIKWPQTVCKRRNAANRIHVQLADTHARALVAQAVYTIHTATTRQPAYLEHDATGVRVANLDVEVDFRVRLVVRLLRRHFRRLFDELFAVRHACWLSTGRKQRPLRRPSRCVTINALASWLAGWLAGGRAVSGNDLSVLSVSGSAAVPCTRIALRIHPAYHWPAGRPGRCPPPAV